MHQKKSLSQNFLIDKNICKKIASTTIIENKNILEIGPGKGILTDIIIQKKPKKLYLVEKDDNLSIYLQKKYKKYEDVIIINNDILNFDIKKISKLNIISNLPYNVSTKIILKLIKDNNENNNIKEMVFMIQKEVALKFDYNLPKMNKYKLFTKLLSYYTRSFDVTPKVFNPRPKVNSSVVKFILNTNKVNFQKLERFNNIIFNNMRKKLSNKFKHKTIDNIIGDKRINEINIDDLLKIYYSF